MDVFVRWRPLVGAETTTGSVEHSANTSPSSTLLAVTVHRRQTQSDKPWKSAAAFTAVLDSTASNTAAYATVVQPTVPRVLAAGCCSFFAYGHSGSGKTHTMGTGGNVGNTPAELEGITPQLIRNNRTTDRRRPTANRKRVSPGDSH